MHMRPLSVFLQASRLSLGFALTALIVSTSTYPCQADPTQEPLAPAETKMVTVEAGKPTVITADTNTEDIICTNDADLALKQTLAFPDSPEASFIYAVALSRTTRVEDALKEVRRARRLAEAKGGPKYFDEMIETYEKMLTYCPTDNQARYHLAWAYYMKAYVLAKYSQSDKYKAWVEQAAQAKKPEDTKIATPDDAKVLAKDEKPIDLTQSIGAVNKVMKSVPPHIQPAVKSNYALAMQKLDEILATEPNDMWSRIYRAHLMVEAGGDIDAAMAEWEAASLANPNNPAPYLFLGEGYLKKGKLKDSMANISKAIALRAVGMK